MWNKIRDFLISALCILIAILCLPILIIFFVFAIIMFIIITPFAILADIFSGGFWN